MGRTVAHHGELRELCCGVGIIGGSTLPEGGVLPSDFVGGQMPTFVKDMCSHRADQREADHVTTMPIGQCASDVTPEGFFDHGERLVPDRRSDVGIDRPKNVLARIDVLR